MNFKQHRNYGVAVAASVSVGYFFTQPIDQPLFLYCVAMFFVILAGSFAPDLDTESIPSKWFTRGLWFGWSIILLLNISGIPKFEYELQLKTVAVLTVVFIIVKAFKHRGPTHALILVPVLLIVGYYSENYLISAFSIGLATHYYCDSISPFKLRNWF